MKKSLLVGRFVIAIVFVFYASLCFAQDEVGEVFNTLTQSSKIIESDLVLDDFMDGNETTRVIVTLIEPAGFQQSRKFVSISTDNSRSFKNLVFRDELRDAVQAAQKQAIGRLDPGKVQIINRFTYIFGFSAEVTLEGLKELEELENVVSISKDRILEAHLAQGIPLMDASTVRNTYNGSGMAIAICDTGIDYTHPRLGGGGFPNSKVIGGYDCGDDDTNPMDAEGHGTCCAGIAAGDLGTVGDYIGGVAYNARLYAVKISYGSGGSAYTSDMIEGWEWCITHQNDDPANPIMVVSTSFGGGYYSSSCDSASPAMTTAAANCVAAGITLFVSSGNDGYTDAMGWPACISTVNSVGAVYDADVGYHEYSICTDTTTAPDQVTCYSNSASFLTLFAPSHDAYTTDIVGSGGYASGDYEFTFGGTSAACPYAAGLAAGLQSAAKSINGSFLSPAEVKSSLTSTGDLVTDPKVPSITKPRINLQAAVDALSPGNVLWNQPVSSSNTNAYADQDFETVNNVFDIFNADDFTNTESWAIDTIYVPGNTWNTGCDLTCATSLNFYIYANSSGVPAGYPDGGLGGSGTPIWSLSVPPSDSRVTLSTGVGAFQTNVTLSLTTPINLSPGTYWFVFYPEMSLSGCCQYGSHVSDTTNGYQGKVINPGDGFGHGATSWMNMTTFHSGLALTQTDWAFRLEGTTGAAFGDELAVDFKTLGIYVYNTGIWNRIYKGIDPEGLCSFGTYLAVDFGTSYGLYVYDAGTWTRVYKGVAIEKMTGFGGKVAVDFGTSYPMYEYNFGTDNWNSIYNYSSPRDTIEALGDKLVVDFKTAGIYVYDAGSWNRIYQGIDPVNIVSFGDKLAVDFGIAYGLYVYEYATYNWTRIYKGVEIEKMAEIDGDLAVDFGTTYGLYVYEFNSDNWTRVYKGVEIEKIAGFDGNLAVDFGISYPIYEYNFGTDNWNSIYNYSAPRDELVPANIFN